LNTVYVEAVGLFAPGLTGWASARDVLAGERDYRAETLPRYKPLRLPANERRRATEVVRLAFGACEDAVAERVEDAAGLASVFAASGGDYIINDQICRALTQAEPVVSPTQFHNSVHNAAAGYWSIATGSRAPSVSLSAYDFTVASGFIEAVTLVAVERWPTLLALYDNSVSWPMQGKRKVTQPFSAALWLTPQRGSASLAAITLSLENAAGSETLALNPALESLRTDNPAARVLPLLELLARSRSGTVYLATAAGQWLRLDCRPC
jgi:hypothetical protein